MDVRTVIKASSFIFAGFFSMSANAALIILDETDVLGVFPGNDADAADFMSDTGITDVVTELFRDDLVPENTFSGTVTKVENLDYLIVKFDGVYGVYDVMPYAVGDELEWHTADFADQCSTLDAMYEMGVNCGASTSHVTGYGVVPVPAAVWLFGSGLIGLIGIARRKA